MAQKSQKGLGKWTHGILLSSLLSNLRHHSSAKCKNPWFRASKTRFPLSKGHYPRTIWRDFFHWTRLKRLWNSKAAQKSMQFPLAKDTELIFFSHVIKGSLNSCLLFVLFSFKSSLVHWNMYLNKTEKSFSPIGCSLKILNLCA